MISDIVLTGILKEVYDKKFRYVETHNNDVFNPSKDIMSLIPTMYWTRDDNNIYLRAEEGQMVVIRGHLESDEIHGLYVLVESVQFFKK